MKKTKKSKTAHTANTQKGMGDFYGSGVRAPLGKVRDNTVGMVSLSKKKLKTPPKTLV